MPFSRHVVVRASMDLADEDYDHGPIILQRTVPVFDHDSAEALAERIGIEERRAYPEAIQLFVEGRLKVEGRRVKILDRAPGAPCTTAGRLSQEL